MGTDSSKVPTYAVSSVSLVRYTSELVGLKSPNESDKLILLAPTLIIIIDNSVQSGFLKAEIRRLPELVEAPTRYQFGSVNAE